MNSKISALLHSRFTIPSAIGVVAFSGGYALGYILGRGNPAVIELVEEVDNLSQLCLFDERRSNLILRDPELERLLDEEERIVLGFQMNQKMMRKEAAQKFSEEVVRMAEDDDKSTLHIPMVVEVEEPVAFLKDEMRRMLDKAEEPLVVFVESDDPDWDYERECNTRTKEEPYVIHRDEFFADEMGYHQETVTYYSGDDIMVDPQDTPIYNYAGLMGELKFGHGSGDQNTVYIRNEVIHMEWEVLYNPGCFSVEVLGIEADKEMEHTNNHFPQRKFRAD